MDPSISHPGLADRFKAIVGSYYIAKLNGFEFKIIFEYPFKLSYYLDYVSDSWIANKKDLSYSLRNSRILAYNGGGRLPTLNKRVKQYHIYCYIGYDILETNKVQNYQELWGELFRELFKPTIILKQALNKIPLKENDFISVHLRFVNALEQFEKNQFNVLSNKMKEKLIQKCLNAVKKIIDQYPNKKVVIFSDSITFLNKVKKELPVIVLEGSVGHISFRNTEDVVLKTFVDFYTMSKSEKVIRILTKEIYATVFSYYAALAGGKKCEDFHA
ncbi:hypothetical protein [Bacteroides sp.]